MMVGIGRRVRGVPDGGEPDHGVRLLQRRRGAELHGVPGHGGRRGRAQQVADPRAGAAGGVQPGGPRRRRRHPPHLRLHLLQVRYYCCWLLVPACSPDVKCLCHSSKLCFFFEVCWYGKTLLIFVF